MSIIGKLVADSVKLVHETKAGIHPSETDFHIKKLQDQLEKNKQMLDYLIDLMEAASEGLEEIQETAIGLRLYRDKKSLSQVNNHLRAAIAHMRGYDWGIFRV